MRQVADCSFECQNATGLYSSLIAQNDKVFRVSEHRQNVLYFSIVLILIMAVHHPLFSSGSALSQGQIERLLEILILIPHSHVLTCTYICSFPYFFFSGYPRPLKEALSLSEQKCLGEFLWQPPPL